ncbi:PucR family transcriptional regulator [Facklamia lactis]|uniref:PucR family transcriptional regulator n=1 Tax=Facklamia lactis TaxID=2749967 RepID=UPI0018CDB916|nr:PucR family transcriptional regulator [Facklamia lactis]MBG9979405.1 PucR family transcriptional regulator [Facklamia lactis]
MGVTVRQILAHKPFKNFKVIAGREGLDNQVQGISVSDSPDAHLWNNGKEFILTSGYIFTEHPDYFEKLINSDAFKSVSCMGIKLRFFKEVSKNTIDHFNKIKVPLIVLPEEITWMTIINDLNILVMNKNIQQFIITNINPNNLLEYSFQKRKVHKILTNMEQELDFPAMLYDVEAGLSYFSSDKFIKYSKHLKLDDFWNPSFETSKEVLCQTLKMTRYRYKDDRFDRPFSWITVPVVIGNEVKAYFVVIEKENLIDYFDQFAMRIGFILLAQMFEQLSFLSLTENYKFEQLVYNLINNRLSDQEVDEAVSHITLSKEEHFYCFMINVNGESDNFKEDRLLVRKLMGPAILRINDIRISVIDSKSILALVPKENRETGLDNKRLLDTVTHLLVENYVKLMNRYDIRIGCSDEAINIIELQRNYERCVQAIQMGKVLFPNELVVSYSQLGPFAWMSINQEELYKMRRKLEMNFNEKECQELLHILKIYLKNNLNYSQTAKETFLHINTIRKRIDTVTQKLNLNLEDPDERLKIEILLRIMN